MNIRPGIQFFPNYSFASPRGLFSLWLVCSNILYKFNKGTKSDILPEEENVLQTAVPR